MASLTQEQTDFLKSHHIPLDKTFDASGLSSKAYKAKMKENGTLVAYGTPPCPKGHTLRNKQANCLQCNPQAVSSIKRQATAGDVYIAISPSQLLTKISTTTEPYAPDQYGARQLAYRMNQDKHGEISDWEVLYIGQTQSIGEFENQLQQHLASQQIAKKLTATSKTTKASQIYDIDIHDVLDLLKTWKIAAVFHDDNKITQFHDSYHQQTTQRKQEQQRLAEAQAERLQAEQNAKILAKQQEQQRLQAEQEKAKQAKLEQKRQRQAQLDQQRQEKLTKQQTKHQAKRQNSAKTDNLTTSQTGVLSRTPNTSQLSGQALWQKLTQTQWLMLAVGVFLLLSVIIFAVSR